MLLSICAPDWSVCQTLIMFHQMIAIQANKPHLQACCLYWHCAVRIFFDLLGLDTAEARLES